MPRAKAKQFKTGEPEWFETAQFKKLSKSWHKKLKRAGFDDAEEFDSPLQLMKQYHNHHFKIINDSGGFFDRQRYYELAGQLTYTYKFKSDLDRKIWSLHAEGLSGRDILKKCKTTYRHIRTVIHNTSKAIKRDAKDILKDLKDQR